MGLFARVVTTESIVDTVYPVGSIYISTVSTNPGTLLGRGTWTAFGAGKTLIGIDAGGDTDFDTVEETGGSKTSAHSHTLSDNGYAKIDRTSAEIQHMRVDSVTSWNATQKWTATGQAYAGDTDAHTSGTQLGGDTDSASPSIVQPYIVTYMWKRTA